MAKKNRDDIMLELVAAGYLPPEVAKIMRSKESYVQKVIAKKGPRPLVAASVRRQLEIINRYKAKIAKIKRICIRGHSNLERDEGPVGDLQEILAVIRKR